MDTSLGICDVAKATTESWAVILSQIHSLGAHLVRLSVWALTAHLAVDRINDDEGYLFPCTKDDVWVEGCQGGLKARLWEGAQESE
jgi:hypothetical protein